MKTTLLLPALALCLLCPTDERESGMIQTYLLPEPRQWDIQQPLKCKAVSTVRQIRMMDEGDKNTLVAELKSGADRIELTLVRDTLLVRVGEARTDRYRVTANTKSFLVAVFIGDRLPVIHSIVVHKEKSYVSWTTNEPADSFTNVPYSQSIFFVCP